MAAEAGHLNIVRHLLENPPHVNNDDWETYLNAIDWNGETALHHAVKGNNMKIVEYLIDAGIDTTVKNNQGLTFEALKKNVHDV